MGLGWFLLGRFEKGQRIIIYDVFGDDSWKIKITMGMVFSFLSTLFLLLVKLEDSMATSLKRPV